MSSAPKNPLSSVEPWSWVADGYVEITMPLLAQFAEPAITLAALNPEMRVVDIATGPGTVACRVAPHVKSVHAIDFSAAMIERCRARAAKSGARNIEATLGDGQALPYPTGFFDVGFSMFGLIFFPDRAAGFRELFRVLRPGGRAFVASWAPVTRSPLMQALFSALIAADPSRAAPQRAVTALETPEQFTAEMAEAGFEDISIEPVFREAAFHSVSELCDGVIRGSAPMELMRRALGEAEWTRQVDIMRSHLGAKFPSFPVRLGSTALLASARKPS